MGVKYKKLGIASLQTELFIIKSTKLIKISFSKTKNLFVMNLWCKDTYILRNKQHIFC